MTLTRRACAAWLLASAGTSALAQDSYPNRLVKIIVPVAAGQSTDILARLLANELARSLSQPFVVENKPGAGTTLGTGLAARSPADGYTLVMATSAGFAVAPAIYARLSYDPQRDFAPICNLATVTQTLVTAGNAPWNNLKEFLEAARSRSMNYASAGVGSTSHLIAEAFMRQAGIKLTHVPFKGSSEAQPQVMTGDVQVMFDALPAVLPQVDAGRLKILGVGSLERTPFYPKAPTLAEQGLPGFEAVGWIGLAAPVRTPAAVLARLNTEVRRMMATPKLREQLRALYFNPAEGTAEEFKRFMATEIEHWGRVAKAAGIQPE